MNCNQILLVVSNEVYAMTFRLSHLLSEVVFLHTCSVTQMDSNVKNCKRPSS